MKAALMPVCAVAELCGCASCPPPQTIVQTRIIDTGCDWTRTITVSPADTAETKHQIIAHNDARAANCPPAGN
jgi:hypothetical protein